MARLPESLEGRPWIALALSVAVAAAGFALVVPVGIVLAVALGITAGLLGFEPTFLMLAVLSIVALQGVAFPLAAFTFLRLRGKGRSYVKAKLPSLSDAGWALAGYVGAFVLMIVALSLVQVLDAPQAGTAPQREQLFTNPEFLLLFIPLSFLLVGPGEELLFRGAIQSTLRESFSAPVAIVVTNLMFAPAHITAYTGSPAALVVSISVLFVPATVFGVVYEMSENLAVPTLAHGAYNATLAALAYVAITVGPGVASGTANNTTAALIALL